MRGRARRALRVVGGLAGFLWWLPSIALATVRLWGGRLRFEAVIALGRALVAVGWSEAASRLYSVEIRRAERKMRAVEVVARIDEPHAFVSAVERGERRLDVIEFARYCRAVEADPVALFSPLIGAAAL